MISKFTRRILKITSIMEVTRNTMSLGRPERSAPSARKMCSLFEPGIYSCLCCETVLFDASEKFESHTGWPSFTQSIKEHVLAYRFDGPAFLKRVETICNTCDAHLGHVFPDGPAPSGLRYCMNAVALRKVAKV